ncbi:titin homolog isoform X2 [Adelges cooleyi]|uniref:titin homolog isoform X2 n=1 Tax=Adelges cooleyi TaxID=133065 RepID=UPI00217FF2C7|nr:titin homolog isoform X2 [Adelges cooleyi]
MIVIFWYLVHKLFSILRRRRGSRESDAALTYETSPHNPLKTLRMKPIIPNYCKDHRPIDSPDMSSQDICAPVFLRRLNDLHVRVGGRTRLLIELEDSADVQVRWYKNNQAAQSERYQCIHEGGFYCLDIVPVTLEDEGLWVCTAQNLIGKSSTAARLTLTVPKAFKKPIFVEGLKAILTQRGIVSLECKVIGVPTPKLRWFKDGKEVKAGDIFALTANSNDDCLGIYTCEASNVMGISTSTSRIHVTHTKLDGELDSDSLVPYGPPPKFIKGLENASGKVGGVLVLKCQVDVPPWPRSVGWYNNNGIVDEGPLYHLIADGLGMYGVEIKTLRADHNSKWKCIASSATGAKAVTTCTLSVSYPKNYRVPRFLESLRAIMTDEGMVSFECKVIGYPTPQLSWFKDGKQLQPGDVYELTGSKSLGSYCCLAQNCMGEASSFAELTVEDIENQLNDNERLQLTSTTQPPRFIVGLKSAEANINEPLVFTVKVTTEPEPSISWFRENEHVTESDHYRMSCEQNGTYFLSLGPIEIVDQAEWKCVAINKYGQTVTSSYLKLNIPKNFKTPKFLEELRIAFSNEGSVNLECKVIGVPQPQLKWFKDGQQLNPGDMHKIISGQGGTCCLGTYTCQAHNCMGTVSSSATLMTIEDKSTVKSCFTDEYLSVDNPLVRNESLSTILEERTSQMEKSYTIEEPADVSFSFDGKEVTVSLYETPDLTHDEALQIIEMYADELSENITEDNFVDLPSLRIVKESSISGHVLMEALVIDVPVGFCRQQTVSDTDMDAFSITEDTTLPHNDKRDSLADNSLEFFSEHLSEQNSKSSNSKKDEFYSASEVTPNTSSEIQKQISEEDGYAEFQTPKLFMSDSDDQMLTQLNLGKEQRTQNSRKVMEALGRSESKNTEEEVTESLAEVENEQTIPDNYYMAEILAQSDEDGLYSTVLNKIRGKDAATVALSMEEDDILKIISRPNVEEFLKYMKIILEGTAVKISTHESSNFTSTPTELEHAIHALHSLAWRFVDETEKAQVAELDRKTIENVSNLMTAINASLLALEQFDDPFGVSDNIFNEIQSSIRFDLETINNSSMSAEQVLDSLSEQINNFTSIVNRQVSQVTEQRIIAVLRNTIGTTLVYIKTLQQNSAKIKIIEPNLLVPLFSMIQPLEVILNDIMSIEDTPQDKNATNTKLKQMLIPQISSIAFFLDNLCAVFRNKNLEEDQDLKNLFERINDAAIQFMSLASQGAKSNSLAECFIMFTKPINDLCCHLKRLGRSTENIVSSDYGSDDKLLMDFETLFDELMVDIDTLVNNVNTVRDFENNVNPLSSLLEPLQDMKIGLFQVNQVLLANHTGSNMSYEVISCFENLSQQLNQLNNCIINQSIVEESDKEMPFETSIKMMQSILFDDAIDDLGVNGILFGSVMKPLLQLQNLIVTKMASVESDLSFSDQTDLTGEAFSNQSLSCSSHNALKMKENEHCIDDKNDSSSKDSVGQITVKSNAELCEEPSRTTTQHVSNDIVNNEEPIYAKNVTCDIVAAFKDEEPNIILSEEENNNQGLDVLFETEESIQILESNLPSNQVNSENLLVAENSELVDTTMVTESNINDICQEYPPEYIPKDALLQLDENSPNKSTTVELIDEVQNVLQKIAEDPDLTEEVVGFPSENVSYESVIEGLKCSISTLEKDNDLIVEPPETDISIDDISQVESNKYSKPIGIEDLNNKNEKALNKDELELLVDSPEHENTINRIESKNEDLQTEEDENINKESTKHIKEEKIDIVQNIEIGQISTVTQNISVEPVTAEYSFEKTEDNNNMTGSQEVKLEETLKEMCVEDSNSIVDNSLEKAFNNGTINAASTDILQIELVSDMSTNTISSDGSKENVLSSTISVDLQEEINQIEEVGELNVLDKNQLEYNLQNINYKGEVEIEEMETNKTATSTQNQIIQLGKQNYGQLPETELQDIVSDTSKINDNSATAIVVEEQNELLNVIFGKTTPSSDVVKILDVKEGISETVEITNKNVVEIIEPSLELNTISDESILSTKELQEKACESTVDVKLPSEQAKLENSELNKNRQLVQSEEINKEFQENVGLLENEAENLINSSNDVFNIESQKVIQSEDYNASNTQALLDNNQANKSKNSNEAIEKVIFPVTDEKSQQLQESLLENSKISNRTEENNIKDNTNLEQILLSSKTNVELSNNLLESTSENIDSSLNQKQIKETEIIESSQFVVAIIDNIKAPNESFIESGTDENKDECVNIICEPKASDITEIRNITNTFTEEFSDISKNIKKKLAVSNDTKENEIEPHLYKETQGNRGLEDVIDGELTREDKLTNQGELSNTENISVGNYSDMIKESAETGASGNVSDTKDSNTVTVLNKNEIVDSEAEKTPLLIDLAADENNSEKRMISKNNTASISIDGNVDKIEVVKSAIIHKEHIDESVKIIENEPQQVKSQTSTIHDEIIIPEYNELTEEYQTDIKPLKGEDTNQLADTAKIVKVQAFNDLNSGSNDNILLDKLTVKMKEIEYSVTEDDNDDDLIESPKNIDSTVVIEEVTLDSIIEEKEFNENEFTEIETDNYNENNVERPNEVVEAKQITVVENISESDETPSNKIDKQLYSTAVINSHEINDALGQNEEVVDENEITNYACKQQSNIVFEENPALISDEIVLLETAKPLKVVDDRTEFNKHEGKCVQILKKSLLVNIINPLVESRQNIKESEIKVKSIQNATNEQCDTSFKTVQNEENKRDNLCLNDDSFPNKNVINEEVKKSDSKHVETDEVVPFVKEVTEKDNKNNLTVGNKLVNAIDDTQNDSSTPATIENKDIAIEQKTEEIENNKSKDQTLFQDQNIVRKVDEDVKETDFKRLNDLVLNTNAKSVVITDNDENECVVENEKYDITPSSTAIAVSCESNEDITCKVIKQSLVILSMPYEKMDDVKCEFASEVPLNDLSINADVKPQKINSHLHQVESLAATKNECVLLENAEALEQNQTSSIKNLVDRATVDQELNNAAIGNTVILYENAEDCKLKDDNVQTLAKAVLSIADSEMNLLLEKTITDETRMAEQENHKDQQADKNKGVNNELISVTNLDEIENDETDDIEQKSGMETNNNALSDQSQIKEIVEKSHESQKDNTQSSDSIELEHVNVATHDTNIVNNDNISKTCVEKSETSVVQISDNEDNQLTNDTVNSQYESKVPIIKKDISGKSVTKAPEIKKEENLMKNEDLVNNTIEINEETKQNSDKKLKKLGGDDEKSEVQEEKLENQRKMSNDILQDKNKKSSIKRKNSQKEEISKSLSSENNIEPLVVENKDGKKLPEGPVKTKKEKQEKQVVSTTDTKENEDLINKAYDKKENKTIGRENNKLELSIQDQENSFVKNKNIDIKIEISESNGVEKQVKDEQLLSETVLIKKDECLIMKENLVNEGNVSTEITDYIETQLKPNKDEKKPDSESTKNDTPKRKSIKTEFKSESTKPEPSDQTVQTSKKEEAQEKPKSENTIASSEVIDDTLELSSKKDSLITNEPKEYNITSMCENSLNSSNLQKSDVKSSEFKENDDSKIKAKTSVKTKNKSDKTTKDNNKRGSIRKNSSSKVEVQNSPSPEKSEKSDNKIGEDITAVKDNLLEQEENNEIDLQKRQISKLEKGNSSTLDKAIGQDTNRTLDNMNLLIDLTKSTEVENKESSIKLNEKHGSTSSNEVGTSEVQVKTDDRCTVEVMSGVEPIKDRKEKGSKKKSIISELTSDQKNQEIPNDHCLVQTTTDKLSPEKVVIGKQEDLSDTKTIDEKESNEYKTTIDNADLSGAEKIISLKKIRRNSKVITTDKENVTSNDFDIVHDEGSHCPGNEHLRDHNDAIVYEKYPNACEGSHKPSSNITCDVDESKKHRSYKLHDSEHYSRDLHDQIVRSKSVNDRVRISKTDRTPFRMSVQPDFKERFSHEPNKPMANSHLSVPDMSYKYCTTPTKYRSLTPEPWHSERKYTYSTERELSTDRYLRSPSPYCASEPSTRYMNSYKSLSSEPYSKRYYSLSTYRCPSETTIRYRSEDENLYTRYGMRRRIGSDSNLHQFSRRDRSYHTTWRTLDRSPVSTTRLNDDLSHSKEMFKRLYFCVRLVDQNVPSSSRVKFWCCVIGYPEPRVEWFREGQKLNCFTYNASKRYQIKYDNGIAQLIIENARNCDSGEYTCVAMNTQDRVTTTGFLTVYTSPTIFGGSPASKSLTSSYSVDGYTSKYVDKLYVWNSDDLRQKTKYDWRSFDESPRYPKFMSSVIADNIATYGGTIALQVRVQGTPLPNITWLRESKPLPRTSNKYIYLDEGGLYTLLVKESTIGDSGTYVCRACNLYGSVDVEKSIKVVSPQDYSGHKNVKPAIIVSRPKDRMSVAVGEDITVTLRVAGEPKPKVIWMRGARDVTFLDRSSKETVNDYVKLSIKRAQLSDAGTYFIVAKNIYGSDRAFVTVGVRNRARSLTPPRIRSTGGRWPKDGHSYYYDVNEVPGPVQGEPRVSDRGKNRVTLEWDKPAVRSEAILVYKVEAWSDDDAGCWKEVGMTAANNLDVYNLKPETGYKFRVTARNRFGWGEPAMTSDYVVMDEPERLPEFVQPLPGETKVLVNDSETLHCHVRGTPKPQVKWFKDGELVTGRYAQGYTERGKCTLTITNAGDDDGGRFVCEATNDQGRICTYTVVEVIANSEIVKAERRLHECLMKDNEYLEMEPKFTKKLINRRVEANETVRLSCQVTGLPVPSVSWSKEGRPVDFSSGHINVSQDSDNFCTLELVDVKPDDDGSYTATASNALGSVYTSCILEVINKHRGDPPAPEFLFGLPDSLEATDAIALSAQVDDFRPVKAEWFRDDVQLRNGRRVDIVTDHDGKLELRIAEVTKRDSGVYTLRVSNDNGTVKSCCDVTVNERKHKHLSDLPISSTTELYSKIPKFVVKPKFQEVEEGTEVIIDSEIVGDPVPKVTWLRDGLKPEYYRDGSEFLCVSAGSRYQLKIPHVKLSHTGTYTLLASNPHGQIKTLISVQVFSTGHGKKTMENGIDRTTVERLPRISRGLADVVCSENDSVSFECKLNITPEADVRWHKDGKLVRLGKEFRSELVNNDTARLEITKVGPLHQGVYTCTAFNELGQDSTSARLTLAGSDETQSKAVNGQGETMISSPVLAGECNDRGTKRLKRSSAPKFYAVLHDKIVDVGDTVRFQCSVSGYPPPWSSWEKDGQPIGVNSRMKIREDEDYRSLEIFDIVAEDAGLYRVTVENKYGKIQATAKLQVLPSHNVQEDVQITAKSSPRPNGSRKQSGSTACSGDNFTLSCDIRGNSMSDVTWYKNNEEIKPDERVTASRDELAARLSISNLEPGDSGVYTCIARSESGVTRCSTELSVFDANTAKDSYLQPPIFVEGLVPKLVVREGERFELPVKLQGAVPMSIAWFKDDLPIPDCEDFTYVTGDDGVFSLSIADPFSADSGTYSCKVLNTFGEAVSYGELLVQEVVSDTADDQQITKEFNNNLSLTDKLHRESQETPTTLPATILWGPCDTTVMRGAKIILETSYAGTPEPRIQWLRAGKVLESDEHLRITNLDGISSLTIESITADDCGKYVVRVDNELGNDYHYASVAVEGPPDPPAGRPVVSVSETSADVTWSSPAYDGGCMVTGYSVEVRPFNQTEWKLVADRCYSLSHIVRGLAPGESYVFRVRAENMHGSSEASLESIPVYILQTDYGNTLVPKKVTIESGDLFTSQYEVLDELGKGRYGVVHKVKERDSSKYFAAKFVRCIKAKDKEKAQEEVDIMNCLRHPKLLQLEAAFENAREVVMVTEYISGGELFERVVADDFTLTEKDCILFTRQICEGVDYMHKQNVVHLDLKPENIMCQSRTSHQIKLIDFGLAQIIQPGQPVRVLFGTPEFIPPEIISYEPIGLESDMWSVGVICYVLLSGLSPFMGDNDAETFTNITKSEFDFDDEAFDAISQDAKDFISSLLIKRKEKRLTAKECLKHKWLAQQDMDMRCVILSTDKLKKFIIRRKWQKTGNAIRALGRMATLSAASRRGGGGGTGGVYQHYKMTSLSEEDSGGETGGQHSNALVARVVAPCYPVESPAARVAAKPCDARSDSGISDCSSLNVPPPPHAKYAPDEIRAITEETPDRADRVTVSAGGDGVQAKENGLKFKGLTRTAQDKPREARKDAVRLQTMDNFKKAVAFWKQ